MLFVVAMLAFLGIGTLLGLLSFRFQPSGALALALSLIPPAGVVMAIVFC